MHYKLLTLLIGALLVGNAAHAKIFRVGYAGTPLTGVDYATLQAAHDAASAGDTVQIYGTFAGSTNITKRLVILGYGYNFDVHPGLQVVGGDVPSQIGNVYTCYFKPGCDGTILKGVNIKVVSISPAIASPISNLTFERCEIEDVNFSNNISYGSISNIKFIGCVFQGSLSMQNNSNGAPVTDLLLSNCILANCTLYNSGTTAIIENCVSTINSNLNFNEATIIVKNCILWESGGIGSVNSIYQNNFFHEAVPTTLPMGSNNQWAQDWGVIFNRLGGTDDTPGNPYGNSSSFDENYYILKSGSPAIGAGIDDFNNTTDCGIFGGNPGNQYIVSGVPPVPSFYRLTAPGTDASANPYNITVSVKSNN